MTPEVLSLSNDWNIKPFFSSFSNWTILPPISLYKPFFTCSFCHCYSPPLLTQVNIIVSVSMTTAAGWSHFHWRGIIGRRLLLHPSIFDSWFLFTNLSSIQKFTKSFCARAIPVTWCHVCNTLFWHHNNGARGGCYCATPLLSDSSITHSLRRQMGSTDFFLVFPSINLWFIREIILYELLISIFLL